MTFAIFHDFPGLENGLPKFHDFPGQGGTLSFDDSLLIFEGTKAPAYTYFLFRSGYAPENFRGPRL